MIVEFKVLGAGAHAPRRAHEHDAGYDLFAAEAARLAPGERASVGTGIAVAIPGSCAGLAARHGIALVNSPGLIDAGYRGELRVLLLNTDPREPFEIAPGDRIAQLIVIRAEPLEFSEVVDLTETARAVGGFGSTGR